MKKFFAVLIALFFLAPPLAGISPAHAAETKYGRALHSDIGFYKDNAGSDLLFFLPYSYYVKVLVEGEPYSLVECHDADGETTKIVGYVLTDSLYFDGTLPVNPYLELAVSLKRDAFLYADRLCTEKLTKLFYNDKNQNNALFRYYGYAYDAAGEMVYYVEFFYDYGYLKAEDVFSFHIPDHPDPIPSFEPETPAPPDDDTQIIEGKGGIGGVEIAIICCIVLAGIFVAAFLFRPAAKKRRDVYFDDGDYD